jgi:hypothetical protein
MANYPWNMRKLLDPASDKEDANYTQHADEEFDCGRPEAGIAASARPAASSKSAIETR